jgi:Zn-finger nucleic acid-binding protein/uncharacterized OB-fold protein
MTDITLDSRLGIPIAAEVCPPCQAFWFDHGKDFQLSPRSTLQLMKYIGEHSLSAKPVLRQDLMCPQCGSTLTLAHDIARNVRFTYWNCPNDHGHFIGFFEFLKEKNFIHPLSPQEVQKLRESVHAVNCSSCGASIDLKNDSVCPYCHSPITMLDLKGQRQMLEQLKQAAEPKPVDPTLPLKLAMVERQTEAQLQGVDDDWWLDARSSGDLVQAGLNVIARWLTKS